ncbi:transcriptional regulator [Sphingomonas sp. JC676]|uniref:transcriptional regulator n=1 Tax=Sphingomonas sp. JC676 TaxID=2768065 RepID=UPI0016576AAB|nr:transcriptional regulator [Sphingomonas sp. JC676]MBC9033876.1 transcriptional regulator [Sphingomonas sp. JC676]
MLVFLDFEASSLGKGSYPIEVAWVFADGRSESHLILPAPGWTDWDDAAQAIHRIDRRTLLLEGMPHQHVAQRMVEVLTGHDLLASAPSWDGKWLSALLRAAGFQRHGLRLRRSDEAMVESARSILSPAFADTQLASAADEVMTRSASPMASGVPAHRALPDAEAERARWLAVCASAGRLSRLR